MWNMNFDIAARRGRVDRRRNFFGVQSNQRPLRSAQHHNGDFAPTQILLVLDVLVSGKKNVEPSRSPSVSKSPLESVSHPRVLASVTAWSIR
jgi:hypothetical protein